MKSRFKRYSLVKNWLRLLKKQLVIPVLRSQHPPQYNARGVGIGLAWAMTPLVGIQMWLVLITWIIARKIFNWPFSLAIGCAWTWVTNVVTVPPVYYLFYITGQVMRGRHINTYERLKELISETFLNDLSFWEQWVLFFKVLLNDWGVSMAIGCLPWALIFGVGGYYLTLYFGQKKQQKKKEKKWIKQKI